MTHLLDTNICIEIIRRKSRSVIDHITSHDIGDVGIGAITVAELEYGVQKSAHVARNRIALLQFLSPFDILPFDQAAAGRYGKIRSTLEGKGITIGAMDMLIAAQALSANVILVTSNVREFERVPELKLEDWRE
jgi:tRNA(fMet)-specific endonuclease VapC